MEASKILGRQIGDGTVGNNNTTGDEVDNGYWWYSPTADAIKWAVVAAILLAFSLYFLAGHLHARRRMQKGLPPLAYHRWLVSRRQKAAFLQQHPQYANQFAFYRAQQERVGPYGSYSYAPGSGQAYQMGGMYGPPPPAYHEPEYVPAYTPPQKNGPNKVDPDQRYNPPSGPPPARASAAAEPTQPEPARVAP
ncbi:uncharacterized protein A1O5_02418 [Cladophialophora psammophila CBS 110553]|uniref:Ubiquitin-protein ligase sel1 n=1 Tax=Cladophialophora psammophila CBS 110553 TaxID=1182543 RepID=W9XV26_9EURO|nr:uncharacterized protein A1O5_02418 [Cladophialophora psammophila CBS 110553]EXJ74124.1 hypothetical protein A1O5_02418 [Cladophialophora psammophila CBS 110553]